MGGLRSPYALAAQPDLTRLRLSENPAGQTSEERANLGVPTALRRLRFGYKHAAPADSRQGERFAKKTNKFFFASSAPGENIAFFFNFSESGPEASCFSHGFRVR